MFLQVQHKFVEAEYKGLVLDARQIKHVGNAACPDGEDLLLYLGRAAVNSYTGGFEFTPDGAFSTSEIAQTLMAGSDEAMQAETVYMGLLGNVDSFRMEGANLVLVGDGTDLLEFEPVQ